MIKKRSPEARAAALALLEKYKAEHAEEYAEAQAARARRLANLAPAVERRREKSGKPAPAPKQPGKIGRPRMPYYETVRHKTRQDAEARRAERREARYVKEALRAKAHRAAKAKEKPARKT